jgi:outer membrane receptor protein involved in Fe transport
LKITGVIHTICRMNMPDDIRLLSYIEKLSFFCGQIHTFNKKNIMFIKKNHLILLFCLINHLLLAQNTSKIEGKLMDANTPVEFAVVLLFAQNDSVKIIKSAVSDSTGNFQIDALALGNYKLKIQMIGFLTKTINVSLDETHAQINMGNIPFSLDDKFLKTVEISAKKAIVQRTPQGLIINASATLTQEGGTVTDLLRNTPTVVVDAEGAITLRGKTPAIMINGRNSSLTNTDQIPASSIESIEIINNPSAKYDADAEAGIINIRLKKSLQNGTNGAVSLGTGYGAKVRFNSSVLLNHKVGKWNIGLAYDNRIAPRVRMSEGDRVNFKIPPQYFLTQRRTDERIERNHNLRFNFDYALDAKNSFNLEFIGNTVGEDNDETLKNLIETQARLFTNKYNRRSLEIKKEMGFETAFEYKKKFAEVGKNISLKISSSFNDVKENTDINTQTLTADNALQGSPFLQRTHTYENSNVSNFQLDYALPITPKSGLEMGVKTILRFLESDYLSQNKISDAYITNANASDIFTFKEQIQAGYLQYNAFTGEKDRQIFKYAFGLRGEQIWNNGVGIVSKGFKNSYFNLFPTANIAYFLKQNEFIKLSYARRINRPRLGQLNPFTDITDSLTQRSGNPKLLPELVHSLELGYNKDWDKASFSTIAFYRNAQNVIQNFTILRPDGVLFSQPLNFGSSTTFGLENILSATFTKAWDFNLSASFFQQKIDGNNINSDLVNDVFSWNGKFINNFSVWKGGKLQVIGIYNAPIATPQGKRIEIYNMDMGFQQKILKDKGRLGIIATDIFNTQKNGFIVNDPNFTFIRIFKVDTRAVLLTFAYTFGTKFKEKLMDNKFSND